MKEKKRISKMIDNTITYNNEWLKRKQELEIEINNSIKFLQRMKSINYVVMGFLFGIMIMLIIYIIQN